MLQTVRPRIPRTITWTTLVLLLIFAMAALARFAHAEDLSSAYGQFKKGDYAHALSSFLALAKLGQPEAQLDLARMYRAGLGVTQSDIHAYAWAMLAAQNGETEARELADEIRPQLAPGSTRIAGWITEPYTPAALRKHLLPLPGFATPQAAAAHRQWIKECYPQHVYVQIYPDEARREVVDGDVFVAYTVLPDGRARIPRVVLEMPPGVFGAATRESVLRDSFAPFPAGSPPVQCVTLYQYEIGVRNRQSLRYDYPRLAAYAKDMHRRASAGDPNAQLIYGMLLVGLPQMEESSGAGLPWFVQAAQAGIPLAQFEVGYSLLMGLSCQLDAAKAVTWLRMAADQNEPNAEVTLAMGAMRGAPGFGDAAQIKNLLEKAATQGNYDGELYLAAFLAAAADPGLRDPQRALGLLHEVIDGGDYDPTPFEIRAAAQAAEGDFSHAVSSEKSAIGRARFLRWDLAPLRARLADYQAHKAWYGDLLDF